MLPQDLIAYFHRASLLLLQPRTTINRQDSTAKRLGLWQRGQDPSKLAHCKGYYSLDAADLESEVVEVRDATPSSITLITSFNHCSVLFAAVRLVAVLVCCTVLAVRVSGGCKQYNRSQCAAACSTSATVLCLCCTACAV
jgi:hypothetical protein